jgi:mannose-6-phosphate isomerase-like protein (cupin superfamily)
MCAAAGRGIVGGVIAASAAPAAERWSKVAHASKDDLPIASDMPGFESRQAEWGDFSVAIETIAGGMDATEMFSSLPDGRCQTPHWGYVIKGRARIKYADREEVISAGEAYYMEPGHIPVIEEDSVIVEFSPRGEYQETIAALES